MDVRDRLEQVSTHLRSIDIYPYLRDTYEPFEYHIHKNAFDTPLWNADASYHSPIGNFYMQVIAELGEYWTKILVYNASRCVYKHVLDITQ